MVISRLFDSFKGIFVISSHITNVAVIKWGE